MEKYSQMSLLEVAAEILRANEGKMKMEDLLNAVLAAKEIEDVNNEHKTQLYLDITTSAKFVYMGEEEWDLKDRQPLKEYDKDGSEFNSKDDFVDDDAEEVTTNFEEDDDEKEDSEDDDFEDSEDNEDDLDDEFDEDYSHTSMSDDDFEHDDAGNILDRYNEDDDFDEDKYNDYMDDFEDMYDDN